MQDLDGANHGLDCEALQLYPQGHPRRSVSLNNLASKLSAQWKQFGAMQNLDEAIVLCREALDLRSQA